MRVVIRGNDPSRRIWSGDCNRCKSRMEEIECNILNMESDPRNGDKLAHAKCPVCGDDFILYPTKKFDQDDNRDECKPGECETWEKR